MIRNGGAHLIVFFFFIICFGMGYGFSVSGSEESATSTIPLFNTSTTLSTETVALPFLVSSTIPLTTPDIVINEIMVQPVEPEKEWVELYNVSGDVIDISGWTLSDEIGVIATASGTIAGHSFFVIELTKTALNNGGDGVFLKRNEEIIHKIIYGDAKTVDHDIESIPGIGKTIARNDAGTFFISQTTTRDSANNNSLLMVPTSIMQPTTTAENVAPITEVPLIIANGLIVINEFVSDPTDNADEFIELFNTGNESVNMSGWYIEDGSETKSFIEGTILPKGFFVIDKPKGILNNSGDEITLYTSEGQEIDRVVFGIWDDGNIMDNAPAAKDPNSTARRIDVENTLNNSIDFVVTNTATKGATNNVSLVIVEHIDEAVEQVIDRRIIINEIFPNPKGSDSEGEFIELKNISSDSVTITGWKIGDSSKTRYTVPETKIMPGEYAVFFRKETKISLNNSGSEIIRLFTTTGALVDSGIYEGSVEEDESFARDGSGIFSWTTHITPGNENVIAIKNNAPEIVLSLPKTATVGESLLFDASDTVDQENDALTFSWFMGDEKIADGEVIQYTFATSGKHSIILQVSDAGKHEATKEMSITVKKEVVHDEKEAALAGIFTETAIAISEAYFDPEGSDAEEEFIEVYNGGDVEIDMSGWFIDDAEGGSKAFLIPDGIRIGPKQYFAFSRDMTNIALNNTDDSVRLLFPDKTVAEEVVVMDVQSGAVYMKDETGIWVWSGEPTPGEPNRFVVVMLDEQTKKIKGKDGKIIIKTTIDGLKNRESGEVVMVQGTVAVKPGVFGTTMFYIVDKAGIQITLAKKYMPAIDIGDRVEVVGVLGEVKGERRIVAKKKEDVRLVHAGTAPEITKGDIISLGEEEIGSLVMIEGEVMEKKGMSFYVDDGTGEIVVTPAKGVKTKGVIKEGDIMRVSGIIRFKTDSVYLVPRINDDMQKIGSATSTIPELTIEKKEKKNMLPYIMITIGGVVCVSIIFLARKKNNKESGGLME